MTSFKKSLQSYGSIMPVRDKEYWKAFYKRHKIKNKAEAGVIILEPI